MEQSVIARDGMQLSNYAENGYKTLVSNDCDLILKEIEDYMCYIIHMSAIWPAVTTITSTEYIYLYNNMRGTRVRRGSCKRLFKTGQSLERHMRWIHRLGGYSKLFS